MDQICGQLGIHAHEEFFSKHVFCVFVFFTTAAVSTQLQIKKNHNYQNAKCRASLFLKYNMQL